MDTWPTRFGCACYFLTAFILKYALTRDISNVSWVLLVVLCFQVYWGQHLEWWIIGMLPLTRRPGFTSMSCSLIAISWLFRFFSAELLPWEAHIKAGRGPALTSSTILQSGSINTLLLPASLTNKYMQPNVQDSSNVYVVACETGLICHSDRTRINGTKETQKFSSIDCLLNLSILRLFSVILDLTKFVFRDVSFEMMDCTIGKSSWF